MPMPDSGCWWSDWKTYVNYVIKLSYIYYVRFDHILSVPLIYIILSRADTQGIIIHRILEDRLGYCWDLKISIGIANRICILIICVITVSY